MISTVSMLSSSEADSLVPANILGGEHGGRNLAYFPWLVPHGLRGKRPDQRGLRMDILAERGNRFVKVVTTWRCI